MTQTWLDALKRRLEGKDPHHRAAGESDEAFAARRAAQLGTAPAVGQPETPLAQDAGAVPDAPGDS